MLTAEANRGFEFLRWVEGDTTVSEEPAYAFEILGDTALTVEFTRLAIPALGPIGIGVLAAALGLAGVLALRRRAV